jgi:hypothetical protein
MWAQKGTPITADVADTSQDGACQELAGQSVNTTAACRACLALACGLCIQPVGVDVLVAA